MKPLGTGFALLVCLAVGACVFQDSLDALPACWEGDWCPTGCHCVDNQACVPDRGDENASCDPCPHKCEAPKNAEPRCENNACIGFDCLEGKADCDQKPDNGCEIDLKKDPAHCGLCNNACEAGKPCTGGVCECAPGKIHCDGGCVDPMSSSDHCGKCDKACRADQVCQAGDCRCPDPLEDCEEVCSDLKFDPEHCGSCATVCDPGLVCSERNCKLQCDLPTINCGGVCVDPKTDGLHCGGCDQPCTYDQFCSSGLCRALCSGNETLCNGTCTDLQIDVANCGDCGNVCSLLNATAKCVAGTCQVEACTSPYEDCTDPPAGEDGCATDTMKDLGHCGGCGHQCFQPNATPVCEMGSCLVLDCNWGWAHCSGKGPIGCETQLGTATDCGSCGDACTIDYPYPNATAACDAETLQCQFTGCRPGYGDCNEGVDDGCEKELFHDPANCGICGHPCANGQVCEFATCIDDHCIGDWTNCNGSCVNIQTDPENCNECGNDCPSGHCEFGSCVGTCTAPNVDCNGSCTDIMHDPLNCNGCGNVCLILNAIPVCSGGQCSVFYCVPPYSRCIDEDRCAYDTSSDVSHCGPLCTDCLALPNVALAACVGGICHVTCTPPMAECDGDPDTVCETNTDFDPFHCGGCDSGECPFPKHCEAGSCVPITTECGTSICEAPMECCLTASGDVVGCVNGGTCTNGGIACDTQDTCQGKYCCVSPNDTSTICMETCPNNELVCRSDVDCPFAWTCCTVNLPAGPIGLCSSNPCST